MDGGSPDRASGVASKELWGAALVFVAFLAIAAWPWLARARHALADPASLDDFSGAADARLLTWVLAWNAHALWTQPLHWFDANIFFPARNMLAGSESLIGLLPLSLPLSAATGDPLFTANVTAWLTYPLSAIAMYAFLRLSTVPILPSGIGAALFCFGPFRLPGDVRVLQLPAFFLPLLSIAVQTSRPRRRLWLPLVALLALSSSLYMAVMSGGILLLELVIALATKGVRATSRLAVSLLPVLPLVVLAFLPYVRQATVVPTDLNPLSVADLIAKAFWEDLLLQHPAWRATFVVAALLAVVGIVAPLLRRERPSVSWVRWVCLLTAGLVIALGPSLQLWGLTIPLPLRLFEGTPLAALRGFPRFLVLSSVGMCGLAAAGATELVRAVRARTGRAPAATLAAVALLVVATLPGARALHASPLSAIDLARHRDVDRLLAASSGAVLEIPGPMRALYLKRSFLQADYMLRSTDHWRPLVNGHTGYAPWWFGALFDELPYLPERASLEAVAELTDVEWIVVHHELVDEREWASWRAAADSVPWLRVIVADDAVLLLRLERPHRTSWAASLAAGRPIPGATVLGTPRRGIAAEAAAARLEWRVPPPQAAQAGASVAGVLRVGNVGTAAWPALARREEPDDQLVVVAGAWSRADGSLVGDPIEVRLPRDVLPGDRVYLRVEARAPEQPGSYVLTWRVRQVGGAPFALSPGAEARVTTQPG